MNFETGNDTGMVTILETDETFMMIKVEFYRIVIPDFDHLFQSLPPLHIVQVKLGQIYCQLS